MLGFFLSFVFFIIVILGGVFINLDGARLRSIHHRTALFNRVNRRYEAILFKVKRLKEVAEKEFVLDKLAKFPD